MILLTSIGTALNRLQLGNVAFQLQTFVGYVTAVLTTAILAAGLILSLFIYRVVLATATVAQFGRPKLLATAAQWAVVFATGLLCLAHIGVPREIIAGAVGITYLTLCITFVLEFGIGGGQVWPLLFYRSGSVHQSKIRSRGFASE